LPVTDSQLYRRLIDFKIELILYMMAATKQQKVKKAISRYFTKLRRVGIALKGRDLKKMQLEPGPIYREVLQAVLDARLDGKLKTKDDEINYARQYIAGR
jgi:tRNA nucleotidyltransferase (CCA-adding enzyme)